MADINASLLEAHNGPAPQQKQSGVDRFQLIEGSDGAQHVKITDLTGTPFDIKQSLENLNASIKANKITPIEEINVSNFPPIQNVKNASVESKLEAIENKITNKVEITNQKETQNVKDTDVKTELEAIKQSIADTKATQEQILDKLNGTLDTQLTGSKVEDRETLTVFEREVRNAGVYRLNLSRPNRAKGMIIELITRGSTGIMNLNDGGGMNIEGRLRSKNFAYTQFSSYLNFGTKKTISGNGATFRDTHLIYVSPTIVSEYINKQPEDVQASTTEFVAAPLTDSVAVALDIKGDFEGSEGIDSQVHVTWLFE